MNARISRRQFFQWTGCGLFAAAFPIDLWRWGTETGSLARVTRSQINIYRDPDFQSEIIARKQRDDLIHVYYPLTVERGVNRLWYRTWGGYVHCAYLQPVSVQLNPVLDSVPEPGVPVEVTVPFSQSMRYRNYIGWGISPDGAGPRQAVHSNNPERKRKYVQKLKSPAGVFTGSAGGRGGAG